MRAITRALLLTVFLTLAGQALDEAATTFAAPDLPSTGAIAVPTSLSSTDAITVPASLSSPDAIAVPASLPSTGPSANGSDPFAGRTIRPMPMPEWRPQIDRAGAPRGAVIYDTLTKQARSLPLADATGLPSTATSFDAGRVNSVARAAGLDRGTERWPGAGLDRGTALGLGSSLDLGAGLMPGLGTDGVPQTPGALHNFSDLVRVDDPSAWPWRPHVRLIMRYGKDYMACSGSLIDQRHVLTAGHCIFTWNSLVPSGQRVCPGGDTGSCWVDEVQVVPGYRARTAPYGVALDHSILAFEEYTMTQNINWDMAVLFLERPVGALTGHIGYGYSSDDDFYLDGTFRNPGYPAAQPYNGEQMYDSSGTYDKVEGVSLIFSRGSYGGQSGSTSYALDDNGNGVAYAVASTASDKITRHVRFNARIFSTTEEFVADNMPDDPDLSVLDVSLAPARVSAGDALTSVSYLVHNYAQTAWSGTVRARYYLSEDEQFGAGDRILKSVTYDATIPPLGSRRVTEEDPPIVPESVGGGAYYLGVFLDIKDADYGNNTTGKYDVAQLRVDGAAGVPTPTTAPIPAMTQTPSPSAGRTAHLPIAYTR